MTRRMTWSGALPAIGAQPAARRSVRIAPPHHCPETEYSHPRRAEQTMERQQQGSSGSLRAVTVLGAGTMGSAIARRLLSRGFGVRVWNRSPGPLRAPSPSPERRRSPTHGKRFEMPAWY